MLKQIFKDDKVFLFSKWTCAQCLLLTTYFWPLVTVMERGLGHLHLCEECSSLQIFSDVSVKQSLSCAACLLCSR